MDFWSSSCICIDTLRRRDIYLCSTEQCLAKNLETLKKSDYVLLAFTNIANSGNASNRQLYSTNSLIWISEISSYWILLMDTAHFTKPSSNGSNTFICLVSALGINTFVISCVLCQSIVKLQTTFLGDFIEEIINKNKNKKDKFQKYKI